VFGIISAGYGVDKFGAVGVIEFKAVGFEVVGAELVGEGLIGTRLVGIKVEILVGMRASMEGATVPGTTSFELGT